MKSFAILIFLFPKNFDLRMKTKSKTKMNKH